jgi:hypothetical protein
VRAERGLSRAVWWYNAALPNAQRVASEDEIGLRDDFRRGLPRVPHYEDKDPPWRREAAE